MLVHETEQFSPRLLENIKSAVELYAIFETANSTVGSQIEVTCEMTYVTDFLTVKFKFGELELTHGMSWHYYQLQGYSTEQITDWWLYELRRFTREFVDIVLNSYNKLPKLALVIALWENAGIALGGEW